MLSYRPADGRQRWRRPFATPAQLDSVALCLRKDARFKDILQGILQVCQQLQLPVKDPTP